jgi:hypothetical protein
MGYFTNYHFKLIRKIRIWFAFFLVLVQPLYAQTLECGTTEPSASETRLRSELLTRIKQKARIEGGQNAWTYIPVKFHVLRKSNGTLGATVSQLNDIFARMNAEYQNSGIQFYMAGSGPHYIDSDAWYEYDFSEENALTQGNDVPNAANVYVVGSLRSGSDSFSGYSYYPATLAITNRVFVTAQSLADGRSLIHEMGHYFNLLHTFHNNANPTVSLRELVTRGAGANCSTTGDLVCDTPADPYGLPGATTSGCSYTGTVTDANGALYAPSLQNIMSYYYLCGNVFTPQQYNRLSDGLLLRTSPANEYTLNFQPSASVPTQLTATRNASGVLVSFTDNIADESGFILERATTSNGPYTPIAGLSPNTTSYQDAAVVTNTLYYYRVRVSNGIQYSAADTAMVDLFYCKPSYGSPCSPIFIADFIMTQNAVSLISKINSGCGIASYSDFTATAVPVTAGQSYNFTTRAVTGGTGSYFPQHLSIWIDFNQNGIFETSELVFQSTSGANLSPTLSSSISIPANALSGLTRMRLRSQYYDNGVVNNPCGALQFGEAEDYTLQINGVVPPPTTALQVKVWLEGAYRISTGQMVTMLNQRGLLPGQIPVGSSAITTPPGQPYSGSPWLYAGTESVSNYQANVVDWILVSLREGSPSVQNTVYRTAALVLNNGEVSMVAPPPVLSASQSYYIVIEHRNHLGVLSHVPVAIQNGILSYDFTIQNSYTSTSPVSVGEKQIGTVFAMHSCDGNKNLPNQDFVVNVNDYSLWLDHNGRFDLYSPADFNLDAQISASDKAQWNSNNSKFSMVGRQ